MAEIMAIGQIEPGVWLLSLGCLALVAIAWVNR